MLTKMKTLTFCLFLLVFIAATPFALSYAQDNDPLKITVSTGKSSYYIREAVSIQGNLSQNGSPVTSSLVGISILDSSPYRLPVAFRTAPTGVIPPSSPVNFLELYPCDSGGNVKNSFVVKQTLCIKYAIKNFDALEHYTIVTVTLFDANAIPLGTWAPWSGTLSPGADTSVFFLATKIPTWAQPGNATLCASIFSDYPENGGIPYCPEKTANFEIKRNPDINYSTPPLTSPPIINGKYATVFKLSPEAIPGTYTVYVSASGGGATLVQNTTTFNVKSTPTPPQAAFTYAPLEPYVNMSITFDASASTAEGYNDNITKYEWNWGDGSKDTTTTPTIAHNFTQAITYTVTLNVTDTEGLWSTTSKPITILPPVGPTADFIWYPSTPKANQTVTFDATSSKPGWNGTAQPSIVNYEWNFGDGNTTSGNYPTITHKYIAEGNYTVILKITDSDGLTDDINKTVMVRVSGLIGDINGDGTVDIFDAILLSAAYGSKPGQSNWDPRADLNGDNVIDIYDAILLSAHFGEKA